MKERLENIIAWGLAYAVALVPITTALFLMCYANTIL